MYYITVKWTDWLECHVKLFGFREIRCYSPFHSICRQQCVEPESTVYTRACRFFKPAFAAKYAEVLLRRSSKTHSFMCRILQVEIQTQYSIGKWFCAFVTSQDTNRKYTNSRQSCAQSNWICCHSFRGIGQFSQSLSNRNALASWFDHFGNDIHFSTHPQAIESCYCSFS